jgi:hypothetical protein
MCNEHAWNILLTLYVTLYSLTSLFPYWISYNSIVRYRLALYRGALTTIVSQADQWCRAGLIDRSELFGE